LGLAYIPQLDESDCGVACLAMILKKYRSLVSLQKLRELSGTNSSGTTAYGLKQGFEHYGFKFNAVQADESFWSQVQGELPLIAHLLIDDDYTHYVVVYRVKGAYLYIADPGKGKYRVAISTFLKDWTGILLLAEPDEAYQPVRDVSSNFGPLSKLISKQWRLIAIVVALTLVATVLGLLGSFYFQVLIDRILPQKNLNLLSVTSIGLLTLYASRSILDFGSNVLLNKLGQKMGLDLMRHYLKHVLKLPLSFFATRKTGEVFTRFADASKVIDAVASAILTILIDTSMLIAISVALSIQNKLLFSLTLVLIPLYCLTMVAFYRVLERSNRNEMAAGARFNANFIESLKGIETIKAYGEESRVFNRLNAHLSDLMQKSFKVALFSSLHEACKQFIQLGCSVLLLWMGAKYVVMGRISMGQLITYNALLAFYMWPLENIVTLQTKLQTAKVAASRLNEVLQIKPESQQTLNTTAASLCPVQVKHVDFSYRLDEPALKDITMMIPVNQKVALVGESGSGKSTLAKLLVKFYEPEQGSIYYGTDELSQLAIDEIRAQITYVPQESFFFSGTIFDNLVFGCEQVPSETAVINACELVELGEFITQQPNGLQTILEEKAGNLSGGQKQKIALARALLQSAKVIILDEATGSLDALAAKRIVANLMTIPDRTILFIAHQLQIAAQCDQVLVMAHGQIVERGTHSELVEQAGLYSELWQANQ